MKRSSLISGLVLSLSLVGAGGIAANAATYISGNGGVIASSWGTNTRVKVEDISADGFTVRAEYRRNGSSLIRHLIEDRGKGHSRESESGNTVNRVRGCVTKPLLPDACAPWKPN